MERVHIHEAEQHDNKRFNLSHSGSGRSFLGLQGSTPSSDGVVLLGRLPTRCVTLSLREALKMDLFTAVASFVEHALAAVLRRGPGNIRSEGF